MSWKREREQEEEKMPPAVHGQRTHSTRTNMNGCKYTYHTLFYIVVHKSS
jgi:hypothetical protein